MKPEQQDLRLGQKYCRFASSTSSRKAQLGGRRWIDYEDFAKIRRFASEQDLNLGYAARLFLALPYPWTRVDRLVSPDKPGANVREGLNAEGTGARRLFPFSPSIAEPRTVHFLAQFQTSARKC